MFDEQGISVSEVYEYVTERIDSGRHVKFSKEKFVFETLEDTIGNVVTEIRFFGNYGESLSDLRSVTIDARKYLFDEYGNLTDESQDTEVTGKFGMVYAVAKLVNHGFRLHRECPDLNVSLSEDKVIEPFEWLGGGDWSEGFQETTD